MRRLRPCLVLVVAALALAGCASDEYSRLPEPTGPWVPANPPTIPQPLPLAGAAS